MFRSGVGVLTLEYRDERSGIHEAVVLVPKATATNAAAFFTALQVKELPAPPARSDKPVSDGTTEVTQLLEPLPKGVTSIQIGSFRTEEAGVPPSLRAVLYENLIDRLRSSGFSVCTARRRKTRLQKQPGNAESHGGDIQQRESTCA
jgi:hypothetical protein